MEALIAIVACHKNSARIRAIRDTWLKTCKLPYKIFYGEGAKREPDEDEVFLTVPDDYDSLPLKTRAIAKWAVDHGYEILFKCDDDTYVFPERLFLNPPAAYEGRLNISQRGVAPKGWCSGFAYYLSGEALKLIAFGPEPDLKQEDLWVGKILNRNGIPCKRNTNLIALSIVSPLEWVKFKRSIVAAAEFPGDLMYRIHSVLTAPPEPGETKPLNPRTARLYPTGRLRKAPR